LRGGPEAHQALPERYQGSRGRAEVEHGGDEAGGEILLRTHVDALPRGPLRQGFAAYLKGTGALTLVTDPLDAEVELYRFEEQHRRRIPRFERSLGRSPLIEVPLSIGAYLLVLRKEGHEVVRYPVLIERGQHWDGVRPGGREPHPIVLPEQGMLGDDACYVPAGWFWAGGDALAYGSWPRRRYWADAFVMQKCPVTNQRYLRFLNDLVDQGRDDEALLHVPREKGGTVNELGAMIYGRDAQGYFELRPDADGDAWLDAEPVSMVDWHGAGAYAAWWADHDGKAWRLPREQEWEKAARGVDGRCFPWGDYLDPSWCNMRFSHQNRITQVTVDAFPVDASVYGVRGLAGTNRDWCYDVFRADPPSSALVRQLGLDSALLNIGVDRIIRGGAWASPAIDCRLAMRDSNLPSYRNGTLGLRLIRSFE